MIPCVLFEDDYLLIINKPAGMNTHLPNPFANEGIYEWLRNREPRWESLAIIHRLDKETSGLIVFGKNKKANQSLVQQFTKRSIQKKYVFLSHRSPQINELTHTSNLLRCGERYQSVGTGRGGMNAVTHFCFEKKMGPYSLIAAYPKTGRTHQIRAQASELGFPVLGDLLYGGKKYPRLCLHAQEIEFQHPASNQILRFHCPVNFEQNPSIALRRALFDPSETNAFRLVHSYADDYAHLYVDCWADHLLLSTKNSSIDLPTQLLDDVKGQFTITRVFHKILDRNVGKSAKEEINPSPLDGLPPLSETTIKENNVAFLIRFSEGYSVGLFTDQRDNRRKILTNHIAPEFPIHQDSMVGIKVLNTFAYTCGFSVCAAKAGAITTSIDLSKKYLEWGRHNFLINGLNPDQHQFLFGDVFDWLKRFKKKQAMFDVILLDPPTFSTSREHGTFRAEKDYHDLVLAVLPLIKNGGVLFASTNSAKMAPADFIETLRDAVIKSGRTIIRNHYAPQPPDFPIHKQEPGYLKTVWMKIN